MKQETGCIAVCNLCTGVNKINILFIFCSWLFFYTHTQESIFMRNFQFGSTLQSYQLTTADNARKPFWSICAKHHHAVDKLNEEFPYKTKHFKHKLITKEWNKDLCLQSHWPESGTINNQLMWSPKFFMIWFLFSNEN